MEPLSLTTDPAVPYQVVTVTDPAAAGWLHLPSLHAKLLPLAQAAGHEQLHLSCEVRGAGPSDYTYLADGGAPFRRYIGVFEPGGGYSCHDFERVLTEKLQQQVTYQASLKGAESNG